jgi:hypothetical protein
LSTIDQYIPYIKNPGFADVPGTINYIFWEIFVKLPFGMLKLFVGIVKTLLNMLDLTNALSGFQDQTIETSRNIFINLIGGKYGAVSTVSIAFVFIGIAGLWLLYEHRQKKNFFTPLLSLISVMALGFFYYGNVTQVNGKAETGGQFLFQTVQKATVEIRTGISSAISGSGSDYYSDNKITTQYGDYLERYVLESTANFVNSGSTDGTYGTGKNKGKLDYKKLSGSDSQDYISEISKDNPYLKTSGDKLPEQGMMVGLGSINATIFIVPVAVIETSCSVMQVLLLILIILFPVALILSLLPFFRNAVFSVLKSMLALVASPLLLGVILTIFFWINNIIDSAVQAQFNQSGIGQLIALTGIGALTEYLALFIIKVGVFYWGIWKHRDWLMSVISGGRSNEWNGILEAVEGKARDFAESAKEKTVGTAMVGAGAVSGNPQVALQGAQMVAPNTTDKAQSGHQFFEQFKNGNQEETAENYEQEPIQEPIKQENTPNTDNTTDDGISDEMPIQNDVQIDADNVNVEPDDLNVEPVVDGALFTTDEITNDSGVSNYEENHTENNENNDNLEILDKLDDSKENLAPMQDITVDFSPEMNPFVIDEKAKNEAFLNWESALSDLTGGRSE